MDPKKKHKIQTGQNGYYSYNDVGSFLGTNLTVQVPVPFASVEYFDSVPVQATSAVNDPPLEVIGTPDANGRIPATPGATYGTWYITVGRQSSGTPGLMFMYHAEGR